MLNAPTEEYCEIPRTNVIPFPRAFTRRSHAAQSQVEIADEPTASAARETRCHNIQADHRALREHIEAIANARSIMTRFEVEIRLQKAMGGGNAAT